MDSGTVFGFNIRKGRSRFYNGKSGLIFPKKIIPGQTFGPDQSVLTFANWLDSRPSSIGAAGSYLRTKESVSEFTCEYDVHAR